MNIIQIAAVVAALFISTGAGYALPGDLDPTFDADGIATANIRVDVRNSWAEAVIIQHDGKIVAMGADSDFIRYNPDGSVDATFGDRGRVFAPPSVSLRGMALQPDGRIVAAGYASSGPGNVDFALVRYTPDGSLDNSFDTDGVVITSGGSPNDQAAALAVQPDGKIVVAGTVSVSGGGDFAVARYHPDGTLDATFGSGGIVTTSIGSSAESAESIAVQADGKIIAAGDFRNGSRWEFGLVRYNTDGSLDSSFDGDGIVTTAIGIKHDFLRDVAVQADNKIVAVGYSQNGDFPNEASDFTLVRYNADGSLDSGFGSDGIVRTDFGGNFDYALALAIQADDKIVAAGRSLGGFFTIARYNPNGTFDETFDGDGFNAIVLATESEATDVALQADGKIVAVGSAIGVSADVDFALARYDADGLLDPTFGEDGLVTTGVGPSEDIAQALALQPDGKVIVAGFAEATEGFDVSYHVALSRHNADGSLDTAFGQNGRVHTPIGTGPYFLSLAHAAALQPDGKVVVVGLHNTGDFQCLVVRYNPDGSLDTSLDGDGTIIVPPGPGGCTFEAVIVQSDNKIIAAGNSNNDFVLVRYLPDGSLDPSFGVAGVVTTSFGFNFQSIRDLALQADGRIVAAGSATSGGNTMRIAVARYHSDGSLDSSFDGDGRLTTHLGGTSTSAARAVALQPDGKIVVAGQRQTGRSDFALVRYHPDGALDVSFDGDGMVTTDVVIGGNDWANDLLVQPDGKLVAAGEAAGLGLVRYRADGSLDSTFGPGGKVVLAGSEAVALALQSDGKLLTADYQGDDFVVRRFIGMECGDTDGVLEVGEECDLGAGLNGDPSSCCSSSCTFTIAATTCRPGSGDSCDATEACTGSTAICPEDDAPTNAGVACRLGSGDSCDLSETCTGVAGEACPVDDAAGNLGLVCRTGSGDACDADETCSGIPGATCPIDDAPSNTGTLCRSGSGDACDADEMCTGTPGASCPDDDAPANAGFVCRTGSGDSCDLSETCTGVAGEGCPVDDAAGKLGLVCRTGSGDACDADETCSGTPGATCPIDDAPTNTGTLCRSGSGDSCDTDEVCTGAAGAPCPEDDAAANTGLVCRTGSGDLCDPDETCSGLTGASCPPDTFEDGNTECRAVAGSCDVAEFCPGSAGLGCPDDSSEPDGTLCSDGLYCNGVEACQGGACEVGQGPCAGACNEGSDACVSCPVEVNTGCANAARHTLRIRRNASPDRDSLSWRWALGDSMDQAALADPRTTAVYSLCIYQGLEKSLATQIVLSADAERWQALGANENRGFKYRDRDASGAGVSNILLRTSDRNRTSARLTGRGALLPDFPLPLALPVTVQLHNSDTGACLSSELPEASANDSGRFIASER